MRVKIEPPRCDSVTTAFLFGSHARGDADCGSDIDICVVVRPMTLEELIKTKSSVEREYTDPRVTISVYTEPTAVSMAEAGALFIWHLKTEGKLLKDTGGFSNLLFSQLRPYTGYFEEISIYRTLLSDVQRTLDEYNMLLEIDLHVLQMVCRNTFVLLTAKEGKPHFGRKGAFARASKMYSELPINANLYQNLCEWHFCYSRNLPAPGKLPTSAEAKSHMHSV